VVNLHGGFVNVGLEGVVGVGKSRQFVGHGFDLGFAFLCCGKAAAK
jgi:hypothetical protein